MEKNIQTIEKIRNSGLALAAKLVLVRNYDEAKKTLAMILKVCPNDLEIMTLLANVYTIEGKTDDAKRWLDRVFSIDSNYPLALYELGVLYGRKQEWEKAIEAYESAIKHFPETAKNDIADTYQNLGCALWETRRRDEALNAWKTCLNYNPNQKYAKRNLKEFTNEYRLPKSPVPGMDDVQAFIDMKFQEYLALKGEDGIRDMDEVNVVMGKITDVWNKQIASKYGRKLDDLSTKEKIKLFEKTKVFV